MTLLINNKQIKKRINVLKKRTYRKNRNLDFLKFTIFSNLTRYCEWTSEDGLDINELINGLNQINDALHTMNKANHKM